MVVARSLLRKDSWIELRVIITKGASDMNLTRAIFLALAVLVPTSWTVAYAEDAPPADAPAKKEKKSKKKKKADDGAMKKAE
jgi:hypothetical protein